MKTNLRSTYSTVTPMVVGLMVLQPLSVRAQLVLVNPHPAVNVFEGQSGTLSFKFQNTFNFPILLGTLDNLSITNSGDYHFFGDSDYATITSIPQPMAIDPDADAGTLILAGGQSFTLEFPFVTDAPDPPDGAGDLDSGTTTVSAISSLFGLFGGGVAWRPQSGQGQAPFQHTEFTGTITVSDTPEPSSLVLCLAGGLSSLAYALRRRQASSL